MGDDVVQFLGQPQPFFDNCRAGVLGRHDASLFG
jgi:hypothetical protein